MALYRNYKKYRKINCLLQAKLAKKSYQALQRLMPDLERTQKLLFNGQFLIDTQTSPAYIPFIQNVIPINSLQHFYCLQILK